MVIICIKCRAQMDAPQSALNKKVRCPICSEIFIAALPKAELIEDQGEVVQDEGKVVKDKDKAVKVVKEAPVEATAGGDLPIVLSAGSGPAPSAKSEQVDPSDPLGQLAAAGLKPRRRRKTATTGDKKATTARKALASFSAAPPQKVHWPGGKKAEPAPKRGRPKAPTRYRPTSKSKDVWYVIAGDYEYGPYPPQVILAAIQAGKISRGVLMRHALTDSVISAGRILDLLPKQKRPGAGRKPGKSAATRAKSPAADAASSALDSMARGPSKAKPRGKGKRKQSPGG